MPTVVEPAAVVDVLLLDYNGVVVDDEPIHFAVLRDLLAVERIELGEEEYLAHYLGRDDRTCIGVAFRRAERPLEPERERALAARKAEWYAESVRAGVPLVPGVREFVREAARTARVGIVSGALRAEIGAGLKEAGIADAVHCVVCAEDVSRGKPDPEGFRLAVARLAGDARTVRAVVVEDSEPGLAAARALGAGIVRLGTGFGGRAAGDADLEWRSFEDHAPRELQPIMREIEPARRA